MDLDPTVDLLDQTSQTDLNTQDISNILGGLNSMNSSISGSANIAAYGTSTFAAQSLTTGQTFQGNTYTFIHNLGYVPVPLLQIPGVVGATGGTVPVNFPGQFGFYIMIGSEYVTIDSNQVDYDWQVGVDTVNLYVACTLFNQNIATKTAFAQQFFYYLLANPGAVSGTA